MALHLVLRIAALPAGVMGLWDEPTRTLWLDARLSEVERRCTLVHELVHAERGDVTCGDPVLDARQERRVELEAARRLVTVAELAEALRWTQHADEVAELLGVDRATLDARCAALTEAERGALSTWCPA